MADLISREAKAQAREKNHPEARRRDGGGSNAGPHGQAQSRCHVDLEIKSQRSDKTRQEETGLREKRNRKLLAISSITSIISRNLIGKVKD